MPLLRLRSDEQLVALFRCGNNEAFRVIHDRYRQRLFAYTRQMLSGSRQDAEDALQDVFVRAYGSLRSSDRELALRAWLYRIAHNRCIDELRRPVRLAPELAELTRPPLIDPIETAEQRESLRRLVADVRRLPEQQRSALLMRELGGMSYVEMSAALGVSVAAVKSLLVRARIGLAQALEARDTACATIRADLVGAHDRGVRLSGTARRHLHDCEGCREFRGTLRGSSKQLAALLPALGPFGVVAKVLGLGSGGGAASSAAGGGTAVGGSAAAGGALSGGGAASVGAVLAGTGHVATLLAAAAVTAGGAVELGRTFAPHHARPPARHAVASVASPAVTAQVAAAPPAVIAPTRQIVVVPLAAPPHHIAPVRHVTHMGDGSFLPPKPVVAFSNPTVTAVQGPTGTPATNGATDAGAGSSSTTGGTGAGAGVGTTTGAGSGSSSGGAVSTPGSGYGTTSGTSGGSSSGSTGSGSSTTSSGGSSPTGTTGSGGSASGGTSTTGSSSTPSSATGGKSSAH